MKIESSSWVLIDICGYKIEVDDEDAERIQRFRWRASELSSGKIKIQTSLLQDGRRHRSTLARFIFDLPKGVWVSQVHGADPFDYRKCSWRASTMAERQAMLAASANLMKSSKYKGVSLDKKVNKWRASIRPNGRSVYLGVFKTEIEAALAYDRAARIHFGPKAYQNIPDFLDEANHQSDQRTEDANPL